MLLFPKYCFNDIQYILVCFVFVFIDLKLYLIFPYKFFFDLLVISVFVNFHIFETVIVFYLLISRLDSIPCMFPILYKSSENYLSRKVFKSLRSFSKSERTSKRKKKSKTHKHFLQQNHITENLWSPIMIDVSSIATKFIWHQNHVGGTRVTWICDTFKDREAKNHQEGLLTPDGPLGKQSLLCEWISQDLENAWWFMEYVAYILW
jgi:hypothetical protein